jgi:predicted transposase/invertase (TIGR01784 family)
MDSHWGFLCIWTGRSHFIILFCLNWNEEPVPVCLSSIIFFIDYLLRIPDEKLRNEITISEEEIELIYLDRKNPPPTLTSLGELKREWKEEGVEEGIKKGIQKGIEKGIEKGDGERQRKVARKMLKEGFSVEVIERLTELSEEEI